MNRPIKYKIWDRKHKKMMAATEIIVGPTVSAWTKSDEGFDYLLVDGENADFLQYTGWKDKNDKEIYEGDRLNLYVESAKKYENAIVVYSERHCCFCVEKYGSQFNFTDYTKENVGNIFENL